MARRPAAIHWQIARRIAAYGKAGNTDQEAVEMAAYECRNLSLRTADISKISRVLDKISFHQAGYWYGLLSRYLS